jgi:hypothetical protein
MCAFILSHESRLTLLPAAGFCAFLEVRYNRHQPSADSAAGHGQFLVYRFFARPGEKTIHR